MKKIILLSILSLYIVAMIVLYPIDMRIVWINYEHIVNLAFDDFSKEKSQILLSLFHNNKTII